MKGGITYMPNDEVIDYLKNITVGEFISLMANNVKPKNTSTVYTTDELLEHYPMFSRFTLNKAIKEQKLPYYREGHKMYFEKKLVDQWINEHTSTYTKKNKDKYRL